MFYIWSGTLGCSGTGWLGCTVYAAQGTRSTSRPAAAAWIQWSTVLRLQVVHQITPAGGSREPDPHDLQWLQPQHGQVQIGGRAVPGLSVDAGSAAVDDRIRTHAPDDGNGARTASARGHQARHRLRLHRCAAAAEHRCMGARGMGARRRSEAAAGRHRLPARGGRVRQRGLRAVGLVDIYYNPTDRIAGRRYSALVPPQAATSLRPAP